MERLVVSHTFGAGYEVGLSRTPSGSRWFVSVQADPWLRRDGEGGRNEREFDCEEEAREYAEEMEEEYAGRLRGFAVLAAWQEGRELI